MKEIHPKKKEKKRTKQRKKTHEKKQKTQGRKTPEETKLSGVDKGERRLEWGEKKKRPGHVTGKVARARWCVG